MSFTLATYNTQDLLELVPPEGQTLAPAMVGAHQAKLRAAADILTRLDADIVCLQEVESRELIDRVLAHLPPGFRPYGTTLVGQVRDRRGLRLAILSRFPVIGDPRSHGPAESPDGFRLPVTEAAAPPGEVHHFRRGLLESVFDVPGRGALRVFCVHLKSNYPVFHQPPKDQGDYGEGLVRAAMVRMAEAIRLRRLVDEALLKEPETGVVVAGDFNETEGSIVLRVVAGDRPEGLKRGWAAGALHHASMLVPADQRWSSMFRGRKELLDHILLSDKLRARLCDARLYNDALYPARETLGEAASLAPDSDHAPFVVEFHS